MGHKNKEDTKRWMRTVKRGHTLTNGKIAALKCRFTLTEERYLQMLKQQRNKCACCETPFSKNCVPHVDHDHRCCNHKQRSSRKASCGKCIRGLVCTNCNKGLGCFSDSVKKLKKAIEYLQRMCLSVTQL